MAAHTNLIHGIKSRFGGCERVGSALKPTGASELYPTQLQVSWCKCGGGQIRLWAPAGVFNPRCMSHGGHWAGQVGPESVGASEGFLGWIAYLGAANAGIPLSIIVKNYGWEVRRLPRRHTRARQLSQLRGIVCQQHRKVLCVMQPMCSALCACVCLDLHY